MESAYVHCHPFFANLVKVSGSDYDVKKLPNERPVYTVIDQC